MSFQFRTIYLFPLTYFPINKPKYESIPMHDYIHHTIKEIKIKLFWYSSQPIELKVKISLFAYHCIHIISFIIVSFHSMIQETKKKKEKISISFFNVIYHIKKLPIRIIKSWPSFQLISKFSPHSSSFYIKLDVNSTIDFPSLTLLFFSSKCTAYSSGGYYFTKRASPFWCHQTILAWREV